MKTIDQWISEYSASHTHPTNIIIHKICVPLIQLSILGILWEIPNPFFPLNWAIFLTFLSLIFYFQLSFKFAFAMLIQALIMIIFLVFIKVKLPIPLMTFSLLLFSIAWMMQFIGHKIEGKKPSFFKDLQFLLIGPLWTINPLFQKKQNQKL